MIAELKRYIRASGKSLNELGRDAAVDPGQISRFVNGKRVLNLGAASRLAEALGLRLVGPERPEEPPAEGPKKPPRRKGGSRRGSEP
jgi:transcriptional regulator with XRE-family HTH domain